MDGPGVGRSAAETASAVVDTGGVIRAWSPGAQRLLGHAAADLLGRPAAELVAQVVPPGVLAGPAGWHGPLRLHHREGHPVEAEVTASPLDDGGGEPRWLLLATPVAAP
ncbi:PAS domain-containing protein, partial [Streptomyces hainanensis]